MGKKAETIDTIKTIDSQLPVEASGKKLVHFDLDELLKKASRQKFYDHVEPMFTIIFRIMYD